MNIFYKYTLFELTNKVNILDLVDGNDLIINISNNDTITVKNYTNSSMRLSLSNGDIINVDSLQSVSENADDITFGDSGMATCRELKIANNVFTCRLHVEQIIQNKKAS